MEDHPESNTVAVATTLVAGRHPLVTTIITEKGETTRLAGHPLDAEKAHHLVETTPQGLALHQCATGTLDLPAPGTDDLLSASC